MNRRRMLFSSCVVAAAAWPQLTRLKPVTQSSDVQLLVVRKGTTPRYCRERSYIRGVLYGVPLGIELENAHPRLALERISETEELPYEGNLAEVSSVPEGQYSGAIRRDATRSWMTTIDRTWRIELQNVPGRSAIQFHYGRDFRWSSGCVILVGDAPDPISCNPGIDSSEAAVAKLRRYVESNTIRSNPVITVRIVSEG